MTLRPALFLSLLSAACAGALPVPSDVCTGLDAGALRAQTADLGLPDGGAVLWVGAHPDDEFLAAPLLSAWCLEAQARCTFLVMTRGEAGACLLDGGCLPDLPSVRAEEMKASAARFNATLVQLKLPSRSNTTVANVNATWSASGGGQSALIGAVSQVLQQGSFARVLTFDPRHGSTCDAEHQFTGALVITAAEAISYPTSQLWLLGSGELLSVAPSGRVCGLGFVPAVADPKLLTVDAVSVPQRWSAVGDTLALHPSQFDADTLAASRATPAAWRAVDVLPLADATKDDPLYAGLCQ
jgi:LmbE family N-acetylglucosaminyl deacetylase